MPYPAHFRPSGLIPIRCGNPAPVRSPRVPVRPPMNISQLFWMIIYYPPLLLRPREIYPFWCWMNESMIYAVNMKEAYLAWVDEGRPNTSLQRTRKTRR